MDLLESTLKVIENRTNAKESITLNKQDLDQLEQHVNQLKDNLQEIQSISSRNTQILKINNFIKNAFNEHSKESKILFGLIYSYVQEIEENLKTIPQNENSLSELCNENRERFSRIETDFINTLKLLEIMKNDADLRISKESSDIHKEINKVDAEQSECEDTWNSMVDQFEEKERTLNALKLEVEILQDNIDLEIQQQESLVREKKEENLKILEEIGSDIELNNKIFETEESVVAISQRLKDVLECKGDTVLKLNGSENKLHALDREWSNLEEQIIKTENEGKQKNENLSHETELRQKLITENQNKLLACQNRTNELNNEITEITVKLATLEEDIQEVHRKFADEERKFLEDNNLERLLEEHRNLVKNCEELVIKIHENKSKIEKKQEELDMMKGTPNPKLIELREKLKELETKSARKIETEKEMEEIELNLKNLQIGVEFEQTTTKELVAQKTRIERERDENQQSLKNLMMQCDNVDKDIRRLEVLKQEKLKLFPAPAQKRARASAQRQPARKRGICLDVDSDSSVDGERLSYAEFMARKKMMESKKQKK